MTTFLAQFLNGLTIGSFYALVALGYSMVFGVMKLINFAHGDLFTLGAYLATRCCGIGGMDRRARRAVGGDRPLPRRRGCRRRRRRPGGGNLAYRPVYRAGRLPLVVSALGSPSSSRTPSW
jgi:branched-chain amino acid transport system permease protein